MKNLFRGLLAAGLTVAASAAFATDKPMIGIVSISATEANNARFIQGATKAADELGYQVNVVDAAGSADQANAAIQNFAQLGAYAIVDRVFPWSSIGAGLASAKAANIPVVSWGGGLGSSVAATNGSGGPMVVPVNELMLKNMGGKGSILALTYHTGEVCRNREIEFDKAVAQFPDIKVTKNEVRIPAISRMARNTRMRGSRDIRRVARTSPSGAAGTIPRSAQSDRCAPRIATTSRSTASTAMPRRWRTSRTAS
jgi:ribose transport system substrate-binding protein